MADVLNDLLPAYLCDRATHGFSWDGFDCCLFLADWIRIARDGLDPAAALRGRYRTEAECRAIIGDTPWPLVAARCLRRAGLRSTRDPLTGDVGVILPPGSLLAAAAIRSGNGWAMMSLRGIVWTSAPCRLVMAWRV